MAYNLPKEDRLSCSQVLSYLTCPEKYRREYVDGIKPERSRSAALSAGSAVHKKVEKKIKLILAGKEEEEQDLDLLPFFLDTDLEGQDISYWEDYTQKLYKVWYKDIGMSIIPSASELRFEALVGDVPFLGFIDYIDSSSGKAEIVDLKVVGRSKSVADCRDSVQLAVYAITQENPCVRFDSVVKTKTPKVGVARYTFSKGELNYFTDLIGEVATNISKGNFPKANPTSWMCTQKWCGHYQTCRGAYDLR